VNEIRIGHISMQSTDRPGEQHADARKVFARAKARNYVWLTGSEANNATVSAVFESEANAAGFYYVRGGDAWIAVPKHRVNGVLQHGFTPVIKGEAHKFPTRGVTRATYVDDELGKVTVLACHMQTKRTSVDRPHDNVLLATEIGKQARQYGQGTSLVFYGGDQNITDRTDDTFKGQPLTSCWDELKRWPNTGHDNIDVIASYDGDIRVTAKAADAFDDTEFSLNTDHYLIEAVYTVADVGAKIPAPAPNPPAPAPGPAPKPPSKSAGVHANPPVVGGHPNKNSGKGNKPIRRVVIHSAVTECKRGAARALGRQNQTSKTGSWHYAVDPFETIQCSYDAYVCWHAPPNPHSLGIEMADNPKPWPTGKQTAKWWFNLTKVWRWNDKNHKLMLERAAKLTAALCVDYDLPAVFLSVADVKADKKGITIHANVSKAFGQSTHWDPGAWPRGKFMRMVHAEVATLRKT
jgi:hypothetical protein